MKTMKRLVLLAICVGLFPLWGGAKEPVTHTPYQYWHVQPGYRPWPRPYPYPAPYPVPYDSGTTIVNNYYAPYTGDSPSSTVLPAPKSNQAVVCVVLPTTAGIVWVDNNKMESGLSSTRVYTTPDLEPGHSYHYTIKAQWVRLGENVNEERIVHVRPGQTTVVDFTKLPKK